MVLGFYFILFIFQIQNFADETARILVEFLEVAITSIVFLKGIYPPGSITKPISCFWVSGNVCGIGFVFFFHYLGNPESKTHKKPENKASLMGLNIGNRFS